MTATQPAEAELLRGLLKTPAYRKTLALCALVGIPVSLVCFWFLAGLQELQHLLWDSLPNGLGWDGAPWWWPMPLLLVSGVLVGWIASRLPGAGGHVPAAGLAVGAPSTKALPGVVLAATASLPLGAVLGPEAPLIALGGGLALLLRDLARGPGTPQASVLMGVAGAAAAISVIFGSPLIAAVLLIEVVGVGGPQLVAVMLPALLSSGLGALVFTGFGRWTGLKTGGLTVRIPDAVPRLDAADVGWGLLLAVAVAVVLRLTVGAGQGVAAFVTRQTVGRTALCALGAGVCAAVYALVTGRSPAEVASSGQAAMAGLVGDPHAWGAGVLVALLLCKTVAYALCLGSLRGGPIFPALFLGAAAGVLAAPLPGLGVVPAVVAGLAAAGAGVLRLPVTSAVMALLLIDSPSMTPVAILATVAALVTAEVLPVRRVRRKPEEPEAPAQPAGQRA
ncbi:chloride channel protein [Streptomyces racemochromogenes]|uniref:Chloride channel protein n=1 Tax=Streptomyces racemochromogenes TaxID=67353 RepID=A0ABW7PAI3_9ACTN